MSAHISDGPIIVTENSPVFTDKFKCSFYKHINEIAYLWIGVKIRIGVTIFSKFKKNKKRTENKFSTAADTKFGMCQPSSVRSFKKVSSLFVFQRSVFNAFSASF